MAKFNKILYIDYLDFFTLIYSLVNIPFYDQIYFHNAVPFFQNNKVINILKIFKISWMNNKNAPQHTRNIAHEINYKLCNDLFINEVKSLFIFFTLKKYFLKHNSKKNLESSIKRALCGNRFVFEGVTSFALLKYFFKDFKNEIHYIPKNINNYLLCQYFKDLNIKPLFLPTMVNNLKYLTYLFFVIVKKVLFLSLNLFSKLGNN